MYSRQQSCVRESRWFSNALRTRSIHHLLYTQKCGGVSGSLDAPCTAHLHNRRCQTTHVCTASPLVWECAREDTANLTESHRESIRLLSDWQVPAGTTGVNSAGRVVLLWCWWCCVCSYSDQCGQSIVVSIMADRAAVELYVAWGYLIGYL